MTLSSAVRAGPLDAQVPADAFARLLRDKAGSTLPAARGDHLSTASRPDEQQGSDDGPALAALAALVDPPAAAPPPGPSMPCDAAGMCRAMPPMPSAAPAAPPPAPATVDTAPSAPLAAARRMSPDGAATASVLRSEPAAAWEVSLSDPRGVAITLRAERPEGLRGTCAAAPWTLTIAAPALEAAALLRHAPRLGERLAARALAPAHLRIEADHDRAG